MERKVDSILLFSFIFILFLGLLILSSASAPFSKEKFGNSYHLLFRQIILGIIPGFFLFSLILKINFEFFKKYSLFFLLISLVLLSLVFLPGLGIEIRGGKRWIDFGFFSLQPAEFLKLTFILYLANWLAKKPKNLKKTQTFFAFLILLGIISIFLLSQPATSTLLIIFVTSLLMFFLAKTPWWQTFLILFGAAILFLPLLKFTPYRMARILAFLNPDIDPLGIGYQIKQAEVTVGAGKLFGVGFGMSQQKFGLLPQSFSDSIFAIFAHETGFLGSVFLILLYLILFWRGVKISIEKKDEFEKLLGMGISFWLFFQTFINIGAQIRIFPYTGVPLPFVSYGGSHLIAEIGALAFLLKISISKQ